MSPLARRPIARADVRSIDRTVVEYHLEHHDPDGSDASKGGDWNVVSRFFYVAAANALRRQTGYITSDEESTD
jgi:hypothetical protein